MTLYIKFVFLFKTLFFFLFNNWNYVLYFLENINKMSKSAISHTTVYLVSCILCI